MHYRLAHFTDIHLTAAPRDIPWRDLRGKRAIGWANLRLFGRHGALADAARITEAFVEDARGIAPDHVLFTGDATGLSLESEFRLAREILAPLLEESRRITGIPGNHDVYVRSAVRDRLYERYLGETWEESEGPLPAPPIVRLLGDRLALICLKDSLPRGFHDSSGWIEPAQLERLERCLEDPGVRDRVRIVALHYGPFRADGRPDSFLHGLRNARDFLEITGRAGVDLVVHVHLHGRAFLPRAPGRPVPVTTPGSLTDRRHERSYHVYRVDDDGIRLEARRYEERTNTFVAWHDAPGAGLVA